MIKPARQVLKCSARLWRSKERELLEADTFIPMSGLLRSL
jgi:hypothetical protein